MNIKQLTDIPEERIFELVARMDTRGPRYTSYPTVPIWKSDFPVEPFEKSLNRISREGKPVAVYLHLPFCKSRCLYCGCNSCITQNTGKIRTYIDSLKKEIDLVCEHLLHGLKHSQLHLGGGTPTHTPPDMLAELLDYLIERIPGTDDVDRSIEVDPRVTTKEHLKLLVERGFRRISAGLQDLNEDVQWAVRRQYSANDMQKFVDSAREAGFTSVNIDLIYGLPIQNRGTWAETMKGVLNFGPDRLACFGYAHLPSKIKHQKGIKEEQLPSSKERLGMLLDANRFFMDNGFEAIGMDHFARRDDQLTQASVNGKLWRNFMGYTANAGLELLGLGTSAISEFKDLFSQNFFPPEPYQEKIAEGILPVTKGYRLDSDDIIRKAFINHLMCNLEIKIPDGFEDKDVNTIERIRSAMDELKPFEKDGLIYPDGGIYRITPLGQLFLRNLAMPFDRYLTKESAVTFSRTV